jgi:hypothetical protein
MPWSFAICAAREQNVFKETLRARDMTFAPTVESVGEKARGER